MCGKVTKKMAGLWILSFLAMIIIPTLMSFFVNGESENTENRVLAELPVLSKETIEGYPAAFETYYNDNLPFRSKLVQWHSLMKYKVFGESVVDLVMVGEDGWLFFTGGHASEDAKGTDMFTEDELATIKSNLLQTQEYLDNLNIEFVFMVTPGKSSIYNEKLPAYARRKTEQSRTDKLIDYLRKEVPDMRIVYPKEELLAYKEQYPVYCHLDTHWNNLGAYIGAKALLDEIGVKAKPVEELTLVETTKSECDLSNMLNLLDYVNEDENFDVSGYADTNVTTLTEDFQTEFRYQSDAADTRKLFVARDSFSTAMAPYLASFFAESYMPHRSYYFKQSMVMEEKPDIYVLQIAERDIAEMLGFALNAAYDE